MFTFLYLDFKSVPQSIETDLTCTFNFLGTFVTQLTVFERLAQNASLACGKTILFGSEQNKDLPNAIMSLQT